MHVLSIVPLPDLLRQTRIYPEAFFDLMREPIRQGCGLHMAWPPGVGKPHGLAAGFDLQVFLHLAGVSEAVEDSWRRGYHRLPPEADDYLAVHLPEDCLIVAFESAEWLSDFCRRRHLPLLDVRPSPLRFARDLYIALRTDDPVLFQRIARYRISENELRLEANFLAANVHTQQRRLVETGRYDFSLPEGCLVFVGQAPFDASLLGPQGQPLTVADYADEIRTLAAGRPLLHKAHPVSPASARQERVALQEITGSPVPVCLQNAYQLLSGSAEVELLGISSGLLQEAGWFGRKAHVLYQPCVPLVAPGEDGPLEHYQQVHFGTWASPGFWHQLLTPQAAAPSLRALPELAHHHARHVIDQWWDYGKVLTWERTLPYESFVRSGGGLLRDRLDTLEQRVQPVLEIAARDDEWSCCKRWMLARFLAQPEQFGRGGLYQGHEEWGISGQRPSQLRVLRYGLHTCLTPRSRVLEIGCDIGLLGMALSPSIADYTGLDDNPVLIDIASTVAGHRTIDNCRFLAQDLQAFSAANGALTFDMVCLFSGPYPSLPPAVSTVAALVAEHGVLVVESDGPADDGFPARLADWLRAGFAILDKGRIQDDGVTPRAFYLLRKQSSREAIDE